MKIEKLYDLTGIPAKTRMDAQTILFSLELKPNGYTTTTAVQAKNHFGALRLKDAVYMQNLDCAIRLLAETHGLVLLDFSIGGTPGWGSSNPKPNIEKLSFTCKRDQGDKKDFSTTWDLATGEWARPWLICDSVDPSLRSVLSGLLFGKFKVSPAGSLETEYPFLPWKREE